LISRFVNVAWSEHNALLTRREVAMVEAPPKCSQHDLALQLIRVEISIAKIVTDVYGCPYPGCKTEHSSQQVRRTVESGK